MPTRASASDPGKKCAKCGRTLPLSSFRKHKGYGDGYESRCKTCMSADARSKRDVSDLVEVEVKQGRDLQPRFRAMVQPYRDLRDHQAQCYAGCEKDADLVEAAVTAYEEFFNEFAAKQLGGLPRHAKEWVRAALGHRSLLLNVPPRHAKTTLMAIWFPIWLFAADRDTQVIIVSKTIALGEKISRKLSHEMENNAPLIRAFGRFRPADLSRPWRVAKGELEIEGKNLHIRSGDLSLQIRGSLQQILGMEADWVIADDITDRRVARSEVERNGEWDYFLGDVLTRLAPDGKAFCIGQRVHSEDIYGRLARLQDEDGTPAWNLVLTPAILDEPTGQVLWPEVWPLHRLVNKRKAIGGPLFQCMYQQTPEYAGDFVPKEWLTGDGTDNHPGCFDEDRTVGFGLLFADSPLPVARVISVDPSPTMFAGIVVADVIWLPRQTEFGAVIVDIDREQMGFNALIGRVIELTRQYRPQFALFEENSLKMLRDDPSWERLRPMYPGGIILQQTTRHNKHDVELGVYSLAADFERGSIRIPHGDYDSRRKMELLETEILAYPNGRTDDVLMALWFIKANFRRLMPRGALPDRFDTFQSNRAWNFDHIRLAAARSR